MPYSIRKHIHPNLPRMHIVLFDEPDILDFYPLALTRPTGDLRTGIFTNTERWQRAGHETSFLVRDSLKACFPQNATAEVLYVNGRCIWTDKLIEEALALAAGSAMIHSDALLAFRSEKPLDSLVELHVKAAFELDQDVILLESVRDLFGRCGEALEADFSSVTKGRTSEKISDTNTIIGDPSRLFVEQGAWIEDATFNLEEGPIYIGKDAVVMEGSRIRGGLGLSANAQLKMDAKLYGPNCIGPWCKAGGEVGNSVMQAYSNKGHDGYMGNSVLGAWCNLGADTNTSNLKNNYGEVKVWSYRDERVVGSELTFCGLIMGDHSKCAINTQFNTGTTVGVNANVFGGGFPPKFIPSYAWGGFDTASVYELERSYQVAETVMARRKVTLTEHDKQLLADIFEETAGFRS